MGGGRSGTVPGPGAGSEDACPVTLGWIGSASTMNYLKSIERPLRRAAERVAADTDVRLKIVSDRFPDLDIGMPLERKPWSLEEQADDLRSFDIGLMPLADDDWSRGKCAFKLVQYGAVGRPSVAHPVGANATVVEHGVTGLLAQDDDAWTQALVTLINDSAARRRMGQAARRRIVEHYSASAWGERYAASIREAIERTT